MRILNLLILVFMMGCSTSVFRAAKLPLERGLVFAEISQDEGNPIDLSGKRNEAATKVAADVPIDSQSTLTVQVIPKTIAGNGNDAVLLGKAEALSEKYIALQSLLLALRDFMTARKEALQSFERLLVLPTENREYTSQLTEFIQKRSLAGDAEKKVIATIRKWPDQLSEDELEVLYEPPFEALILFVEREFQATASQADIVRAHMKATEKQLRLEAFRESDGGQPEALHLESYDLINKLEIKREDRSGLDLTDEERAKLTKAVADSQEAASAANELLESTKSLNAVYDGFLDKIRKSLSVIVNENWEDVDTKLKQSITEARTRKQQELQQQLEQVRKQLTVVLQFRLATKGIADALAEKKIGAMVGLPAQLNEALKNIPTVLEISKEASELAVALKQLSDLPELEANVTKINQAFKAMINLRVLAENSPLTLPPAAPVATSHNAIRFPLSDAPDTFLDLRSTQSKPNDRIRIRATLVSSDQEASTSEASFRVVQYGYHGSLAPSVVLARPDTKLTGSSLYKFAPTFAWMHTWKPRPTSDGCIRIPLQALQPAIGIQAALLDFVPEESTEVGLGGAVSFWKDKVLVGVGANLGAPRKHQTYYFVGSSLIALLQSIGIGGKVTD